MIDPATEESWMQGDPDTLIADVPTEVPCPDGCRFNLEARSVAVTDTGEVFWLMRCPLMGNFFHLEPV